MGNEKKAGWLRDTLSLLTPSGRKKRRDFDQKTGKEADQIFTKLYPQWAKEDGTFSQISEDSPGGMVKDYENVFKQVRKTRKSQ
jgi:hypothetical protein